MQLAFVWRAALLVVLVSATAASAKARPPSKGEPLLDSSGDFNKIGITSAESLRARGYKADEHYFKTRDGYVLCLVRGRNQLIRRRAKRGPILFVHGAFVSSQLWLANSAGVRPKDFTGLSEAINANTTHDELIEWLGNDASIKSLPFLALNFGYDVWLLNRRGFSQSEQRAGHLNRSLAEVIRAIPKPLMLDGVRGRNDEASKLARAAPGPIDFLSKFMSNFTSLSPASIRAAIKRDRTMVSHNFDPDYWSFSLDEQVEHDIPQAIELILGHYTSRHNQLAIVGHSIGGALTLMALSDRPELEKKISKAILWSPALNVGTKSDYVVLLFGMFAVVEPNYLGPVPFSFSTKAISKFNYDVCRQNLLAQATYCKLLHELVIGKTDLSSAKKTIVWLDFPQPTNSRELWHMVQAQGKYRPAKFKFHTDELNMRYYNQIEPPGYDLGKIKHKGLSIYAGNTDNLISHDALKITSKQLKVPHKFVVINETGINFNHAGYYLHDQVARLVVVPSMLDILQ